MSEANAVGHWQYDLNSDIVGYVMAVIKLYNKFSKRCTGTTCAKFIKHHK